MSDLCCIASFLQYFAQGSFGVVTADGIATGRFLANNSKLMEGFFKKHFKKVDEKSKKGLK